MELLAKQEALGFVELQGGSAAIQYRNEDFNLLLLFDGWLVGLFGFVYFCGLFWFGFFLNQIPLTTVITPAPGVFVPWQETPGCRDLKVPYLPSTHVRIHFCRATPSSPANDEMWQLLCSGNRPGCH